MACARRVDGRPPPRLGASRVDGRPPPRRLPRPSAAILLRLRQLAFQQVEQLLAGMDARFEVH